VGARVDPEGVVAADIAAGCGEVRPDLDQRSLARLGVCGRRGGRIGVRGLVRLGQSLTNLGNCIPDRIEAETKSSKSLDTFFAKATELPVKLEDTDQTTFDSAQLAMNGMIGFAPAYPLWADDAKKMRYVRVPRGESIKFDTKTQTFDIPPNTRFYKTFLKRVIDTDGNVTYRKIETRLIVARPDECTTDASGQHCQVKALMGTYAWNPEETQAELVRDPLRNGKPFTDRLITYVTDEKKAPRPSRR